MPGYLKLDDSHFPNLFPDNKDSVTQVKEPKKFINPYSFEVRDNSVIVHSPIHVELLEDFINALRTHVDLEKNHLLIGVIGQGLTERHIVAMHIPPASQHAVVYDSKYSNASRFFGETKTANLITGLLRNLNPFANRTTEVNPKLAHITKVTYHALGTQSLFDGVSCGYHCASNLKILADLLAAKETPTPELVLAQTQAPVTRSARLLRNTYPEQVEQAPTRFLKKAWQDTFLPLMSEEERSKYHFGHYFMGWPQKEGSKVVYFLTLKFITTPLTNLFSLLLEFPLNALSESVSFLKNTLIPWAPTNGFSQGIRSLLLAITTGVQMAFKGLSLLLRTITSPLISYRAARERHPVLGYLSALTSVVLIGGGLAALAVFAPYILAAIAPSMGPGATTLLTSLAMPFVELFSLMGASLSIATGAMLMLISGGLIASLFHLVGRGLIYPKDVAPSPAKGQPIEQSQDSAKAADQHSDDGFTLVDSPRPEGMFVDSFGRLANGQQKRSREDFKPEAVGDTIDQQYSHDV